MKRRLWNLSRGVLVWTQVDPPGEGDLEEGGETEKDPKRMIAKERRKAMLEGARVVTFLPGGGSRWKEDQKLMENGDQKRTLEREGWERPHLKRGRRTHVLHGERDLTYWSCNHYTSINDGSTDLYSHLRPGNEPMIRE